MARIAALPPSYNEAELFGMLSNRESEYQGLMREMTTTVSFNAIEGKLYRNFANFRPKKITDFKADLAPSKTGSYGIKMHNCPYGGTICIDRNQQKYGRFTSDIITDSIYRGVGNHHDMSFIQSLLQPYVEIGADGLINPRASSNDFRIIPTMGEGLTPDKIAWAISLLRAGNAGSIDPVLLSSYDVRENLDKFDEFKNFDCTYGLGSTLWGNLNNYPQYKGVKWRNVDPITDYDEDGGVIHEQMLPITPHYLDEETIDPENDVHWIPVYNRDTVAFNEESELCIKINQSEQIPGKPCGNLYIDADYGFGLTKVMPKGVVWIGCIVRKNPCYNFKTAPYSGKFPKVIAGVTQVPTK